MSLFSKGNLTKPFSSWVGLYCICLYAINVAAFVNQMTGTPLNPQSNLDTSSRGGFSIRAIPTRLDRYSNSGKGFSTTGSSNLLKYVFAHVVQGNFQFYQAQDWSEDMALAKAMGIDAFAINIGRDKTNQKQLPLIYEVAERISFGVFISFDMGYYGQNNSSEDIISLIKTYAFRKGQFHYQGKPLVATSSGEVKGTFLDNNPNFDAAWSNLKKRLGFQIYFLPCWTGYKPSQASSVDGLLSWDAWSSLPSPDRSNFQQLRAVGKQYAAPISPFFYKHLSADESGNYIYPTDSWYMIEKYLDIISFSPDFVELLSWNNFGESHYLRDPRPSANLPFGTISSEKYVVGMPHEPFLNMISYFNLWYKSGSRPPVNRSKAYVWYRPHAKNDIATSDKLPMPKSANKTEDKIYVFLMISPSRQASRIALKTGSKSYETPLTEFYSNAKNDVLLLVSAPFAPGNEQSLEIFDIENRSVGLLKVPLFTSTIHSNLFPLQSLRPVNYKPQIRIKTHLLTMGDTRGQWRLYLCS
ncbi:hypothetical protein O181_013514 [Austropuccinia psidii MF-1]|uniref:Glycoside hydrolase family 71 protein n=1 Tax=Austropuccinia psidii MF-1 TaxID=1389203 RepID=A0A9Q3GNX9_9BASI|nr:hypothetical protein [Austropuccinia psidii MF-1]